MSSLNTLVDVATEYAFKRVPNWWPRAYLALLLFGFFRDSNYVVFPYMLREKVSEVGLGKTSLYKGLETLQREGIVRKKDQLYILTPKGQRLLTIYRNIEEEIKIAVKNRDIGTINKLLAEVEKLESNTEFENNAKTYFKALLTFLIEPLTQIIEEGEKVEVSHAKT